MHNVYSFIQYVPFKKANQQITSQKNHEICWRRYTQHRVACCQII